MKLFFTLFAGLFLLGSHSGCSDWQADAHTDDHHLEHFVPHHKPANFAEGVEAIEHRCDHLAAHAGHGHDDEADEFQELLDVVNWMPELAADSDLDEAKWNQAVSAANAIAEQLATRKSADGSLDLSDLSQAIATELKTLQTLIPEAGKPETAIHHDHDHGHDGHHGHDHDHDHDHDHEQH
ncbi:hypothetical protein [Fuerstiella marisgermanici]|uniref:Uncharacterized protein n=1 Tax=Fuerstiella marisgermanici TaxID=1891926 RepID=A0A1P8WLE6_9PLAN|nr:hypothetical protein [Fuerstiella marisgermanici]APZ94873.1 hypothetical protein Fuma_04523 [Fuerstiella marisgermanici]